jgi:inosose dehydratase
VEDKMKKSSRREFFKLAATGVAGGSLVSTMGGYSCQNTSQDKTQPLKENQMNKLTLGMASYTFREFSLDDTINMTKRLGLKKIAFKRFHLSLDSSEKEIKAVVKKVKDAGLDLYGCGVVYMKEEKAVHQAFDYAKIAGMRVIIGVPEHNLLKLVNEKVQEYDIKLAIHNHGPGDEHYPSPESAYEKIKDLDSRMGLCLDIGHAMRMKLDPSDETEKYANRLYDIHIRDISAANKDGESLVVGRGVTDIPKLLKTLIKVNYKGSVSLEYEREANDPLASAAESIGYLRGVLDVI